MMMMVPPAPIMVPEGARFGEASAEGRAREHPRCRIARRQARERGVAHAHPAVRGADEGRTRSVAGAGRRPLTDSVHTSLTDRAGRPLTDGVWASLSRQTCRSLTDGACASLAGRAGSSLADSVWTSLAEGVCASLARRGRRSLTDRARRGAARGRRGDITGRIAGSSGDGIAGPRTHVTCGKPGGSVASRGRARPARLARNMRCGAGGSRHARGGGMRRIQARSRTDTRCGDTRHGSDVRRGRVRHRCSHVRHGHPRRGRDVGGGSRHAGRREGRRGDVWRRCRDMRRRWRRGDAWGGRRRRNVGNGCSASRTFFLCGTRHDQGR